jgi:hypothetical protein
VLTKRHGVHQMSCLVQDNLKPIHIRESAGQCAAVLHPLCSGPTWIGLCPSAMSFSRGSVARKACISPTRPGFVYPAIFRASCRS